MKFLKKIIPGARQVTKNSPEFFFLQNIPFKCFFSEGIIFGKLGKNVNSWIFYARITLYQTDGDFGVSKVREMLQCPRNPRKLHTLKNPTYTVKGMQNIPGYIVLI